MLKYIFILGPTTYNKNENNYQEPREFFKKKEKNHQEPRGIFKIHQQSDAGRDSNR